MGDLSPLFCLFQSRSCGSCENVEEIECGLRNQRHFLKTLLQNREIEPNERLYVIRDVIGTYHDGLKQKIKGTKYDKLLGQFIDSNFAVDVPSNNDCDLRLWRASDSKNKKYNQTNNLNVNVGITSGVSHKRDYNKKSLLKSGYCDSRIELEVDRVTEYYSSSRGGTQRNVQAKKEHSNPIYHDERLKNIEPKMIEIILNEVIDTNIKIGWDDISGLDHAKNTIKEIVVWPMLRPDIFYGLRGPPKGLLLFGPPGTGKTLLGKWIASQSGSTFFSISSSSLTSKWIGEGEKMVRALFSVARYHQPSVIFVDEIDSLLCQRTDGEVEGTRRLKTEFLVQFDGVGTVSEDRILVIGATNMPQEIDEAARRRLVKRLYIPLPEFPARLSMIKNVLKDQLVDISEEEMEEICRLTEGYSGSDIHGLCKEASLCPIRDISDIEKVKPEEVRSINVNDFKYALTQVRASVSLKDLDLYVRWNAEYGSLS